MSLRSSLLLCFRLLLLIHFFLTVLVYGVEVMEADQMALQIELGLEWLVTEGACDTLRVVDQAHVLTQVRQVTVYAVADRTGAWVQRVQFAWVSCNTHTTCSNPVEAARRRELIFSLICFID